MYGSFLDDQFESSGDADGALDNVHTGASSQPDSIVDEGFIYDKGVREGFDNSGNADGNTDEDDAKFEEGKDGGKMLIRFTFK